MCATAVDAAADDAADDVATEVMVDMGVAAAPARKLTAPTVITSETRERDAFSAGSEVIRLIGGTLVEVADAVVAVEWDDWTAGADTESDGRRTTEIDVLCVLELTLAWVPVE
jgi:hypothetical protein